MKTPEGNSIRCQTSCSLYWLANPVSPIMICPGCEVYKGADGLTYGSLNYEALVDKNKQEENK